MLWACACMCFFGCMRAGEALSPEGVAFDKKAHLTWVDVQLEDARIPNWIRVRIKESKTDRSRAGAFATLHKTGLDICPVMVVLVFMGERAAGPGPFFKDEKGVSLTRREFVAEVKKVLTAKGIPSAGISGHSFRIGSATAAALSGATDEEVKVLGRWRSREYRSYIRREEGDQAMDRGCQRGEASLRDEPCPGSQGCVWVTHRIVCIMSLVYVMYDHKKF